MHDESGILIEGDTAKLMRTLGPSKNAEAVAAARPVCKSALGGLEPFTIRPRAVRNH